MVGVLGRMSRLTVGGSLLRNLSYTPAGVSYSPKMTYVEASSVQPEPCFRVLNESGGVVESANKYVDVVPLEQKIKMYKKMAMTNVMDEILYSAQRQGRISFYMTCAGEEAAVVASAAAIQDNDEVFAQYREQGVLLWRGFSLDEIAHQCCSTVKEPAKGRQMPVHYGSKKLHFQVISSPLATQIPHAVGAAYAIKLGNEKRIAVCFFGDGAASEGDFHAALNFASTIECPVLFLCRNNGYAISTPTMEQYRGDGVLCRGIGYGVDAIRVDGNDALAVYIAVHDARARVFERQKPVLVELMTYRSGHHSTSDDSSRYRSEDERKTYAQRASPIDRLRKHLLSLKVWTQEEDDNFTKEMRVDVMRALQEAEKERKASADDMFVDVYSEPTRELRRQAKILDVHLRGSMKNYNM